MESLLSDQDVIDTNKKYYEDLVGEGKRFKDNETLARSKYEADLHIAKIEKENEELQQAYLRVMEENKTSARLDALIKELETKQKSNDEPKVKSEETKPYNPEEIESLFDKKFNEREIARRQTDNYNLVKEKLINRYGNTYQAQVKQQINDLGITEDEFNSMARTHPQMLIKTLELDVQPRLINNAPPRSVTTGFKPNTTQTRRYSYYQPLIKAKPHDRDLLIEMEKEAQSQGEAFFDID